MNGRKLKFVLLGGGILASMALLVLVATGNPDGYFYYVTVSEFLENGESETQGFRVNGKVVDGTIQRFPSGQDVLFVMSDGSQTMPVSYHGIIPDTFVDGADVVVQGALGDSEVFQAHELLAKCPSKYESADGYEEDYGTAPDETTQPAAGADVSMLIP